MKKKILAVALSLFMLLGGVALAETANDEAANEDLFALIGVVEKVEEVSMEVLEGNGKTFTLFFTGDFPRCAVSEGIGRGSAVRAAMYGGFDGEQRGDLYMLTDVVGDMKGSIAGIDGEAVTISDEKGEAYSFYFDEFYSRTDVPETLAAGSAVRVVFSGGFDENNQFTGGLFALYAAA